VLSLNIWANVNRCDENFAQCLTQSETHPSGGDAARGQRDGDETPVAGEERAEKEAEMDLEVGCAVRRRATCAPLHFLSGVTLFLDDYRAVAT